PARPHRVGAERTPADDRREPHRCPTEPGLYGAYPVRLSSGHGFSRPAAQAAPGVFPMVRSSILANSSVRVGASFAIRAANLGCHSFRYLPLLPASGK